MRVRKYTILQTTENSVILSYLHFLSDSSFCEPHDYVFPVACLNKRREITHLTDVIALTQFTS